MNRSITYKQGRKPGASFVSDLYAAYGRKMYAYAVHTWTMSEDDAWDLIYKTLYKVNETVAGYTFETEAKFASFVFRIFINYIKNHYRDQKKYEVVQAYADIAEADHLTGHPDESQPGETEETRLIMLREELDKMEDWQRILLLMRSDGRAYVDIAAYTGKPEDQLRVYYQRLKKLISHKINEQL